MGRKNERLYKIKWEGYKKATWEYEWRLETWASEVLQEYLSNKYYNGYMFFLNL